MLRSRIVLTLTGLAFGVWEVVSAFQIQYPAIAAAFAVMFLAATAWFWRRDSVRAALVLLPLFCVEVASAPSWQDAHLPTKIIAMALGAAGITAVAGVVGGHLRRRRVSSVY